MKKRMLFTVILVGLTVFAFGQTASVDVESGGTPGSLADFKWVETTHDFGKINQGTPVKNEFTFTNTGGSPLIISNVKGSCGCTVTKYSKEPVLPGKIGTVTATFNAAAVGSFHKSIRVTANVEGGAETLFIKGEVAKTQ